MKRLELRAHHLKQLLADQINRHRLASLAQLVDRLHAQKHLAGTIEAADGRRPFGLLVKHVIRSAVEEALRLRHNYIGTEHLLLGLYHDPEDDAAKALITLGLTCDDADRGLVDAFGKHRAAG